MSERLDLDTIMRGIYDPDARASETRGIVVRDWEVAHFLLCAAKEYDPLSFCHCEVCNAFSAWWWGMCNSLCGPVRIRLQRVMRETGIPLPPGPWEEVPTDAVFTPFN